MSLPGLQASRLDENVKRRRLDEYSDRYRRKILVEGHRLCAPIIDYGEDENDTDSGWSTIRRAMHWNCWVYSIKKVRTGVVAERRRAVAEEAKRKR